MDDDNGLELSLGLSCGGSSAKSKARSSNSADIRTEDGDRSSKLVDDFKNFLQGGTQNPGTGSQRSDPPKPEESFFSNLSNAAIDANGCQNLEKGIWGTNINRAAAVEEEEKRLEASNKPKTMYEEISHQKKREREAHHADLHDKTRTSYISITTDEGSTADNEDVADSEVEGSTSRLVSLQGCGTSEILKEAGGVGDTSIGDLQGQKRYRVSSEKDFNIANMSFGSSVSTQSVNLVSLPYSLPEKESISSAAPSTSCYPLPGMTQVMAATANERSGAQPGNFPAMFGYSPVQLPTLDKDSSWGQGHPQQVHLSFAGRGTPNLASMPVVPQKSSEAPQYDGRSLERGKLDGKQHVTQEGPSSQMDDGATGSSIIFGAKDAAEQPKVEGSPSEYPAIRPGIAADLKFGGCGSRPNLPWVSTTAPGPNGRTISGVTYRYSATQIRIVCACHGSHMSPEEFVRHAAGEQINPEAGTGLQSFPSNNPAASAQS